MTSEGLSAPFIAFSQKFPWWDFISDQWWSWWSHRRFTFENCWGPWLFFLGVHSSEMVRDGILIPGTGWLALIGLFLRYFKLTKFSNHNFQPIQTTHYIVFLKISTRSFLYFLQFILSNKFLHYFCPAKKSLDLSGLMNFLNDFSLRKKNIFTLNTAIFLRIPCCIYRKKILSSVDPNKRLWSN